MDFFNQSEIDLLNEMAGKQRDKANDEKQYNDLKNLYEKVGYWGNIVKYRLFSEGKMEIRKRPTSQWSKFEFYHWAKLFPQRDSNVALAYTLSLEEYSFIVKIDTVGLTDDKPIRRRYLDYRGDFEHSKIVRIKSSDDVLTMNWDSLVEWSIQELQSLKPDYDKLTTLLFPTDTSFIVESNRTNPISMQPLNIILYGPPGTGKTYHTIDLAVSLIDEQDVNSDEHDNNKIRFDELKKAEQIEFITFHQNYSYEDFMVGLRPHTEGVSLSFKKHEGIFYQICKRAEKNYLSSLEEGYTKEPSFEEVFDVFLQPLVENEEEIKVKMKSDGWSFHITGMSKDNQRLHFRKQSGGTGHDLVISNIKAIYEGSKIYNQQGLGVYYNPLNEHLQKIAQELTTTIKTEIKQYVLVIDEINRANISRVFGELITLLEDDKRIGATHELRITLPNGEIDFGIPPNLHVIGTMNTADKSIALVDIALRRRFEFIGKYPTYEAKDNYTSEKANLLKAINEKVYQAKKTADFLIGHAYFMKDEAIETTLKNKVIPLLMEYFNNRIDEVQKVFAETTWSVQYDTNKYDWEITDKSKEA